MRHAVRKAGFVLAVLIFWGILLVPAVPLLDWLVPPYHRADGLYPADDRKWANWLALIACLALANWAVGASFRALRISEGRWSLFRSR